jgi:VIT1/CCC1 family predicted Fe2+/Mn2+ transporter
VLGANSELMLTASLMLGVDAVKVDAPAMAISRLASLLVSARSMDIGEFMSMCS